MLIDYNTISHYNYNYPLHGNFKFYKIKDNNLINHYIVGFVISYQTCDNSFVTYVLGLILIL